MFPTPGYAPPAFQRNGHENPRLCLRPSSKQPRSVRPNPSPAGSRHRLPSASSLSCSVHVSPPGTRRFAASRGPTASLSPAPRHSQSPQSHTAFGSDSPNCCRGLHRRGRGRGPHSETARLRLSVPGAPPSWPLNTQRSSGRRRRLAPQIVGKELQFPEDTARLRIPKGLAARPTRTWEEVPGLATEPGNSSCFKRSRSGTCYSHTVMHSFVFYGLGSAR